MIKRINSLSLLPIAIAILLISCKTETKPPKKTTFKVAFGSCGHQDHPLPILNDVVDHKPDVFVYLGDNIYGDTKDMAILKDKYQRLASKPSFQNLKQNSTILATWDDHDFGWNDAGRHYAFKNQSKEIFLDFFEEPEQSERRNHSGIYTSYYFEVNNQTVQLILLDVRTFRDNLIKRPADKPKRDKYFYHLDYDVYQHTDSTLLGHEQWQWLDKELQKPAQLRIIGSGTQFGIEYNGYEAWANFPHEQKKMLNLIKKNKANGVVFITGDVHYAEISKLETEGLYPIYDFTSSGLSSTWHFATPNANRVEGPIMANHFGLLTFDTKQNQISMEVFDTNKNQRLEYTVPLTNLQFQK